MRGKVFLAVLAAAATLAGFCATALGQSYYYGGRGYYYGDYFYGRDRGYFYGDDRGWKGGFVRPCSLDGVNPVFHPGIFGNPAVARSYGFILGRDGIWRVIPGCNIPL
jgi:hypothetical protein